MFAADSLASGQPATDPLIQDALAGMPLSPAGLASPGRSPDQGAATSSDQLSLDQLAAFASRIPPPLAANHLAEVIETSTTEFLAQCLEPEDLSFPVMPAFGSWVRTVDEHSGNVLYSVVYHATTSPIDSVHRARALGLSLQDLRQQQPQIFAMLKTEFRAALVGFCHAAQPQIYYHHLPPRPPQIHQAVYACDADEIVAFTQQQDFLRTLLQVPGAPVESLVAATIREIYRLRRADRDWLVQAGRSLSILLKDDYDRLRMILGQIHP